MTRMRRVVGTLLSSCIAAVCTATAAQAQSSPAVERATTRARAMFDAGDGAGARTLLDSLVGAVPAGTSDLAEALYWRAVLAERVNEAERDWKKLVIEVPLSPRTPDALVRLGELDMLRGHPADARTYFTRLLRDFPSGEYRANGLLWLSRSYFDERDNANACSTLDLLRGTDVPDGELRLQSSELMRRCATPSAKAPAPTTTSTVGRYSVQLAAYDTRAEADASVQRIAKRNVDARVDGDQKPFRVRVGYHATHAAATAALAALKKQGFDGFVAERAP